MSALSSILFPTLIGLLVGWALRRYFILTSGSRKTNLPFIKDFNLLTGSKDIIFTNNKILAVNAHDRHLDLGDTFGCYFGQSLQIFSRDPNLILRICVNDFQNHPNRFKGESLSKYMEASLLEARYEKWQNSRRAVASVLKGSKLKVDKVDIKIENTIDQLLVTIDRQLKEAQAKNVKPDFDIYQINKNYLMQSILVNIFDTDKLVDFDSEYNDVVEEMHKFVFVNYEAVARICFLMPFYADLIRPFLGFFDHGKYLALLIGKFEKIIAETSTREQMEEHRKLSTIHSLINSYKKGELNRNQLLGNAVFIMMAGFATSIDAASSMMWRLANDQRVQNKLRTELLQYGENSKYLENCVNETLRLNPGSLTNREITEDIHYKNFRIIKGSCFNLSIYSLHRDPKLWGDDAELWIPERFEPENLKNAHKCRFIPFGIGPRNCVGYHLARLNLHKYISRIILKYKLDVCEKTQTKLEFESLGALPYALPIKGPVFLRFTPVSSTR